MTRGSSRRTLEDLYRAYRSRGLGRYKALERLYREASEGRIKLVDTRPPRDFIEYLLRLDYSLWFWAALITLALALLTIYASEAFKPLLYLRYVLGSIVVLYLPGMALIEALYPGEKELSPLERLALSIGLSLAIVPLIGLILNYTPWGIRLGPIVASLSLYTTCMLVLAAYRKYALIQSR